jgi:hypothetical protein
LSTASALTIAWSATSHSGADHPLQCVTPTVNTLPSGRVTNRPQSPSRTGDSSGSAILPGSGRRNGVVPGSSMNARMSITSSSLSLRRIRTWQSLKRPPSRARLGSPNARSGSRANMPHGSAVRGSPVVSAVIGSASGHATTTPATTAATSAAATTMSTRRDRRNRRAGVGGTVSPAASASSRSASTAAGRAAGSRRSNASSTGASTPAMGAGSSSNAAARRSCRNGVSRFPHGDPPCTAANSVAPNENTSAARSAAPPPATSGAT